MPTDDPIDFAMFDLPASSHEESARRKAARKITSARCAVRVLDAKIAEAAERFVAAAADSEEVGS